MGKLMTRRPTRRDMLRLGTAAAATALLPAAPDVHAAGWKDIPVAAQLWCVRIQLRADIPGTLMALGAMGYRAVELENAFGRSGAEWRRYLDAARLRACGFHHRLDALQGDALAATIEFNQAIGNRNLIIRWLEPEFYASAEELARTAETVNEIAERLRPHRMRVGYHNHESDFNRIDGEYWWNRFADQTTEDVILQLDTGNASVVKGVSPADLIRRNPGRTASLHVKPFSASNPEAYLGADELDWRDIMTACETVGGIEWYIIEYEREGVPPLFALTANLDRFTRMRASLEPLPRS